MNYILYIENMLSISTQNALTSIRAIVASFVAFIAIGIILTLLASMHDSASSGGFAFMAVYTFYIFPIFAVSSLITFVQSVRQPSTISFSDIRWNVLKTTGKVLLVFGIVYGLFLLFVVWFFGNRPFGAL